jgi:hypothetical protein
LEDRREPALSATALNAINFTRTYAFALSLVASIAYPACTVKE